MLTVRRIYLYLVSAISLVAVTWSVIGLARLIVSEGIGEGQIIGLATLLAMIIVGLPIFLFHWLMAQRLVDRSEEERESPIRQIYFYVILAIGATVIFSNVYRLVDNGLITLVGGTPQDYYPYDLTTAEHLAAILVWAVVWYYHWRDTRHRYGDQLTSVQEVNLGVRRLYLLAFSLAGLVMVSWGSVGLLQILLQLLSSPIVMWHTPVANYSAQLLVGAAIWVVHWLILQRDFASGHPAEERSVLRKVYLYLAVFTFSVMALASATALLKRLIELALGAPPAEEPLLSQLSLPLPLLVVGIVFWAYHWQVVRHDASQAPEVPRQAGVRRIYAYLVAAVGLTVLLTGVVGLLTQLIDMVTSPPATAGLSYYRDQVALFTAMVLVGAPVWLLPWRTMQHLAIIPAEEGEEEISTGADERRSTVRKIYLYFFVFVAALAVFSSAGWFIFEVLKALLGADLPDDFITSVLNALVIAILAVGVWLYHWWAIRRDGQLEEQEQASRFARILVVVIDGDEGQLGQSIIGRLRHELPGIQLRPVGLTPQATEAMAGQPFSASVLNMAHYITGSWQTLTSAEVAPAITANPAMKLVVPLVDQNWVWTGVSRQSPEYYADQTARGIKQAIDGQEINFGRDMDIGTIAGIAVGVLLFLVIGGSLIGFVSTVL